MPAISFRLMPVLALLMLLGTFAFGVGVGQRLTHEAQRARDGARLVDEVLEIVEREYYDRSAVDGRRLGYGAAEGLLRTLGDPYAAIEPPAGGAGDGQLAVELAHPGLALAAREGQIVVARIDPGSAAERAGVRPGDVVARMDGRDVAGLRVDEVRALLRPAAEGGTTLALRRAGATITTTIEPQPAHLRARREGTEPSLTPVGSVAVIRVPAFGPGSADALAELVRRADERAATGIVLDLRDNPGGYLDAAVAAAGVFVPEGVVLYQRNGDGSLREHRVRPRGAVSRTPLAVLVNGGTASAAEVLAAALQTHGRATLVGEPTYGKGSVQSVHRLSDGASLRLTVAHWLTPNRRDVSGVGVTPDVYARGSTASNAAERADPALAAALARLAAGR